MRELCILQYNVQKSKDKVMVPLFEDPRIRDFDIIAVQEPWQNPFYISTYLLSQSSFHVVFPLEGGRACLYINKRIDLNSWTIAFHSPDLCLITLQLDNLIIHVYSIYCEPPGSPRIVDYNSPAPLLPALLER